MDDITVKTAISKLQKEKVNDAYTQYLRGKKVIIVGPNTDLKGKKLGPWIDKFDVVIRHNTVFEYLPFNSKLIRDYGSRTDVLYFSPQCIKDYAINPVILRKTLSKLKQIKPKFIVYQNGNRDGLYLTGEYCFKKQLNIYKKYLPRLKIALHYSHDASHVLTKLMCYLKKIKQPDDFLCLPRTGFISIFDMMIHQPKTCQVVGMSLYQGGGHAFRRNIKKELDPLLNALHKISPHDSNIELDLMKKFIQFNPELTWQSD